MHNIKKAKRFPGTKEANKYLGPYTVEEVKPSHLVARKGPNDKTAKLPLHMSRKYDSRDPATEFQFYAKIGLAGPVFRTGWKFFFFELLINEFQVL